MRALRWNRRPVAPRGRPLPRLVLRLRRALHCFSVSGSASISDPFDVKRYARDLASIRTSASSTDALKMTIDVPRSAAPYRGRLTQGAAAGNMPATGFTGQDSALMTCIVPQPMSRTTCTSSTVRPALRSAAPEPEGRSFRRGPVTRRGYPPTVQLDDVLGSKAVAPRRRARVDDQRRPSRKRGIVHRVVVGRDKHGIEAANRRLVEDDRPTGPSRPCVLGRGNFIHMGVEKAGLPPRSSMILHSFREGPFSRMSGTFFL